MAFCIMRTQKLKTAGAVASVLDHHLRLRETPNAEVVSIEENWYNGIDYQDGKNRVENNDIEQREKAKARAMEQFRDNLPEKVRKNAVQAVELVMTASPEMMKDPNFDVVGYLNDCDQWAMDTFGKDNVFFIAHHKDETTPHSSVLLQPKDENGKLNCRKFLGGRQKMRELQDSFYEQVGKKYNLERGLKGSKAKHEDIQKFYGAIKDTKEKTDDIVTQITQELPKRGIFDWNTEKYMERVSAQLTHDLTPIVAKHLNDTSERQRTRQLNRTLANAIAQERKDTREAVTEELKSNYEKDLENATIKRTEELNQRLATANAEIARMRREKAERDKKERKEKEKREQEEKERQEREKTEKEKTNEELERLRLSNHQFVCVKNGKWFKAIGNEMERRGCDNYAELIVMRDKEKKQRAEILEKGFGNVGWELTERGTIELFTREMYGRNRAEKPFFEIKEKEWIDALTAGRNVKVREKYYVNSLKKINGKVTAIGCFQEESRGMSR